MAPTIFGKGVDKTSPNESDRLLSVTDSKYDRLTAPSKRTNTMKSYGSVSSLHEDKPSKTSKVDPNATIGFRQLFRYATLYDVFLLSVGMTASIVSGVGMPMSSVIFGGLSNSFIGKQQQVTGTNGTAASAAGQTPEEFEAIATKSCIYYACLGTVIFVSGYIQVLCWSLACERQINAIRRNFFYSVMRQDIAWFDVNASGSLTIKLSDNLERIKEAIGDKLGIFVQSIVQFFAGFGIAFYYSWKLTLVMMCVSPLSAGCGVIVGKLIAQAVKQETENYAKAGAIAEEVLSCVRTVMAFNGQEAELKRYGAELDKGRKMGMRKSQYSGIGIGLTNFIILGIYGLAFWYGATMIVNGEIDRGSVFTVFFATLGGAFVLGRAGPQLTLMNAARGAATSMFDIIDRKPDIDCYSKRGKTPLEPKGRIKFDNVHFAYPTRKEIKVLDGLSLQIDAGESVALVGHSGCGKSTIMNILLRFYNQDSGKVTLDGSRLDRLNINWLRNTIGVVSQEPVLFDGSIEENIRMGKEDVTQAEMVQACKISNCHDFIRNLPKAYKSRVGERGAQMSGGQKQRIAIARALVRNPKILLLDEATSALDAESEHLVQKALEEASKGRTTISIAHRLSSIKNADKIVAMEHGLIKEMGTHRELMEKQGLYYNLVLAQQLNDTTTAEKDQDSEESESQSGDSLTELPDTRKMSRQVSRRKSTMRKSLSGVSDDMSDLSSQQDGILRVRAMSRMLSRADTEKERLIDEAAEEGVQPSTFLSILKESRQEWCYLAIGVFASIVQGVIMPVFSMFYSQIFAAFAKEGQALIDDATFWAYMFVALGIVDGVEYYLGEVYFGYAGENLTMRMRLKVFENILRQDAAFFDDAKNSTGKICTRLATDAPNVKQATSFRVAGVISAVLSMAMGIFIGLYYGWKLALLPLSVCPLMAYGIAMRVKYREEGATSDATLFEEAGKVAVEAIENIRTVQFLTREKRFYNDFCGHLDEPFKAALKEAQIQAIFYGFSTGIYYWLYAGSFRLGAYLVTQGDMLPMDVFKVFFGVNFSTMMLGQASSFFPEYFKAKFAAGLIFRMCNVKPAIDSAGKHGLTPELSGRVKLSNVFFRYPTRPAQPVMEGINLEVDRGKSLALVGPSGCGKSTTVNLIERFYDPAEGLIHLDDYEMRTLNVKHLRQQISLVGQEPILFDCSIEENICYGLDGTTHEQVVDAAKNANIHNFILGLPQGYATRVGEKGTQLSGGQKQRIAIARALVRNPRILLLDEATSALDTESEKVVQVALDKAREGRTCIMIAHRLSTVQNADKIAVISRGKVIESGSHQELLDRKGTYFELSQRQSLA